MSIIATLPVFILSNSVALNGLLNRDYFFDYQNKKGYQSKWAEWIQTASLMRDASRPGHVFGMRWKKYYQDNKISLIKALHCLSNEYLIIHHQRLYIKDYTLFSAWQNLRGRMSLLPIKYWMLYNHNLEPRDFLVHPIEPIMDDYISKEGLNETHLHLHACRNAETSWLLDVNNIYAFEQCELTSSKTKLHLYANTHTELTPEKLCRRMRLANIIRRLLLEIIDEYSPTVRIQEMVQVYQDMVYQPDNRLAYGLSSRITRNVKKLQDEEIKLWYGLFSWIQNKKKHHEEVEFFAHLYLLIQNEYLNFSRHNEGRRGFAHFQMITHNNRPKLSYEDYYRETFRNLFRVTNIQPSTSIELRLAPHTFIKRSEYLMKWWLEEWNKYIENKDILHYADKSHAESRSMLSHYGYAPKPIFVLHFSKSNKDKGAKHTSGSNTYLVQERYEKKRKSLIKECNRLANHVNSFCRKYHVSVGIDASGSELDLPAEVLAPIFRQFERLTGISHRTFHCGEDFHHLLGGIRAVYDAVIFLDMHSGHRLGHATAIGIQPGEWRKHMPGVLCVTKGEYLLDLIFAWKLLGEKKLKEKELIERIMIPLAEHLFPGTATIHAHNLLKFYEARHLDPFLVQHPMKPAAISNGDEYELIENHKTKWGTGGLELLKLWNYDHDTKKRSNEIEEVNIDLFDDPILVYLQQAVQALIYERGITLETLPVSNLRISQYDDIRSHHLLRWLGVPKFHTTGDKILNVCMGSDDPGIFVTDIKNEYYHIFSNLRHCGLSHAECMTYIKRLNEAGRIYAFRTLLPRHAE